MIVMERKELAATCSGITARIIAHSIAPSGACMTTMQLRYPRPIHGEFMTHRVFGRNAASSRAIPVAKMIAQVRNDPFIPLHWGANQPGMQAGEELQGVDRETAIGHWLIAASNAAHSAERLAGLDVHKQTANRLLEPFQWMETIVTATCWDNFYELRDHGMAEPHMQILAKVMRTVHATSYPRQLKVGQWHVPYVNWQLDADGKQVFPYYVDGGVGRIAYMTLEQALAASSARCARVSYLNHDGSVPSLEKDMGLFHALVGGNPIHASPTEHQGSPDNTWDNGIESGFLHRHLHGNLKGFVQHRKFLEQKIQPANHPLIQTAAHETLSFRPLTTA